MRESMLFVAIVLMLSPGQHAEAQSILNGDFENNTSIGCDWNLSNADYSMKMAHSTAFLGAFGGLGEIDIMEGDCGYSSPPQSGTTKIAIATDNNDPSRVDAISLELSSPLVPGVGYELCFYGEANNENVPGGSIATVQIGQSRSPTSFGTLIFEATPSLHDWRQFCDSFIATEASTYITVKNTEGMLGWNHLDNFTLGPGQPCATDAGCDDGDRCTDDTCVFFICEHTLRDDDGDSVCNFEDNCPFSFNPAQEETWLTVYARAYCVGDPEATCLKDADCSSFNCQKAAFEWGTPGPYIYGVGSFAVSSDLSQVPDVASGSGNDSMYLLSQDPPPGTAYWIGLCGLSGTASAQGDSGIQQQRTSLFFRPRTP